MEGVGKNFERRHYYTFCISPDFAAKSQPAKTLTATFYLHNQETKRELKVKNNGKILPFCPMPTYLDVKLDRALTYRQHLEALRKKLSTCVSLLRWLAG